MGRKLMRLLFGSIICRKIGRSCLEQRKVTLSPPRSQCANFALTTTTQSLSTETLAGAPAIPATVITNQAQIDAKSVVSSNSAPTVVSGSAVPGSTILSMLCNAAHLRRDDDSVMVQEGKV